MAHPILVQAAWAIVLARMADRTQAIFGATVSGRPLELADADRIFFLKPIQDVANMGHEATCIDRASQSPRTA